MPARVQRTRPRIKGQRGMPPGSKYVGRGSRWGNPTRVVYDRQTGGWHAVHDSGSNIGTWPTAAEARRFAVESYRHHLDTHPDLAEAARAELAGWDLACWCTVPEPGEPDHCHGALLLAAANATPTPPGADADQPAGGTS